ELLEEDPPGVLDQRRALLEVPRVLEQQRLGAFDAAVRPRHPSPQNRAHGLPIEIELPRDPGLRVPLKVPPPRESPPAVCGARLPPASEYTRTTSNPSRSAHCRRSRSWFSVFCAPC